MNYIPHSAEFTVVHIGLNGDYSSYSFFRLASIYVLLQLIFHIFHSFAKNSSFSFKQQALPFQVFLIIVFKKSHFNRKSLLIQLTSEKSKRLYQINLILYEFRAEYF